MDSAGLTGPLNTQLGYSDYAQLQNKYANADNTPENLTKAARHFESIFIDMWLKSARDANKHLSEGNFLSGAYMDMSQQMLDHEMAVHLADQGGIGLAEVIVRQLSGKAPVDVSQVSSAATSGISRAEHGALAVVNHDKPSAESFTDPESFVNSLLPLIQQALDRVSGFSATALVSQAALETGWGAHVIQRPDGSSSHNLFGIKAKPGDPSAVAVNTKEFEHGRWLNKSALFKAYESWTHSVEDYVSKISSEPRYADAASKAHDPEAYAHALQQAGYATDPDYADKIVDVFQRVSQIVQGFK